MEWAKRAYRQGDRKHAAVRAGRASDGGATGGGGGTVHWWRGLGAGVLGASGGDGGALRAGPVRGKWKAALPERRCGAVAGEGRAGVPWASGSAGKSEGV